MAEVLRLYDPERRPSNWVDIVRPTQFVVFCSDVHSGGTTDANGKPFPSPGAATCLIFDTLNDARRFCETRVAEVPSLRLEVFDARGRVESPLLVIVDPARAANLDGGVRSLRLRKWVALLMIAVAPVPDLVRLRDVARQPGASELPGCQHGRRRASDSVHEHGGSRSRAHAPRATRAA